MKLRLQLLTLLTLLGIGYATTVHADIIVQQEQSGYNTVTQVVGSQQLFVRHQFIDTDFSPWFSMLYRAQAFELFSQLIAGHELTPQGIALTQIVLGDYVIPQGKLVNVELLVQNTPHPFGGPELLALMTKSGVLDNTGFVLGLRDDRNILFANVDFSSVLEQMKPLALPIQNEKVRAALVHELFELVMSCHREIEVTTQDTTRFQSRNNDLFSGMMQTVGGNFLAGIFSPDHTNVSRKQAGYFPHTDVDHFYGLKLGFSPYWSFGDQAGVSITNGDTSRYELSGQLLDLDASQFSQVKAKWSWLPGGRPSYGPGFPFLDEEITVQRIADLNTGNHYFVSATIPYLSFGTAIGTSTFGTGVGLSYGVGGLRNALGFSTHLEFEIPLMTSFLSLTGDALYNFKPDFGQEVIWDQGNFGIGFAIHPMLPLTFNLGYRYLASRTDVNANGITFGLGYTF